MVIGAARARSVRRDEQLRQLFAHFKESPPRGGTALQGVQARADADQNPKQSLGMGAPRQITLPCPRPAQAVVRFHCCCPQFVCSYVLSTISPEMVGALTNGIVASMKLAGCNTPCFSISCGSIKGSATTPWLDWHGVIATR